MKNLTLTLFGLIITLFTNAQNTLEGKITDGNNQPVPFASVYLPQLELGTTASETGEFQISNIPNGNFKVVVTLLGYESKSMVLNFPYSESLNLSLNPSAIEMQEVIVSTPFHKLQRENVMKVERASIKELNQQGALNLSEGLSNIAGVENITTGVSVGKPVIRGLSSNRVLVYTQGIRLENQQFGDEHGLGLNAAGIESAEVIKGPSSLLYGSDALGGVLYLNPERFAESNSTDAFLSATYFGNTQGYNSSVGVKSSGDHFKWLIRGTVAGHSDYETDLYRVTNSRFKEKDLKAGIGYQRQRFKTELRYNYFQTELGLPEEIDEQTLSKNPILPFQDVESHILSSKSSIFLDDSSFDISLGYIFNDRKEFEDHEHELHEGEEEEEEEGPALHMKLRTFNYDVKYNLRPMGRFETIVGVQGMDQENTNFGEETLIPDASTFDIGVLATSHIHFEKLDLQIGARFDNRHIDVYDDFERDFSSFNGAFGIKTDEFLPVMLRFNIASGFRAPNLAELTSDGTHEGTNRYEIGNRNLENEQNLQLDFSAEFKNEHIELFANAFYNYVDNYIFLQPNGEFVENDPVFLYLQDEARLYGGEFGLHFHPHPLDWLHIESAFETVTAKRDDDTYLPLTPANTLTNTFRVELENNWVNQGYAFIRLRTVFDQDNVAQFETPTPGYNLLSAGVGSTFNIGEDEFSLRIAATNLTNKKYISHLSRLKQDNILNIGRNLSFSLSYLF